MGEIASAEPEQLYRYATYALELDNTLQSEGRRLTRTLHHFERRCKEPVTIAASVLGENLRVYGELNKPPDERVREVGKAFARADGQSLWSRIGLWVSTAWDKVKSAMTSSVSLCVIGFKQIINAPGWLLDKIKAGKSLAQRQSNEADHLENYSDFEFKVAQDTKSKAGLNPFADIYATLNTDEMRPKVGELTMFTRNWIEENEDLIAKYNDDAVGLVAGEMMIKALELSDNDYTKATLLTCGALMALRPSSNVETGEIYRHIQLFVGGEDYSDKLWHFFYNAHQVLDGKNPKILYQKGILYEIMTTGKWQIWQKQAWQLNEDSITDILFNLGGIEFAQEVQRITDSEGNFDRNVRKVGALWTIIDTVMSQAKGDSYVPRE